MAIYVGVIIGGFSGYAADNLNLGWCWTFAAAGIVGILHAIPLLFLLKDPPPRISAAGKSMPGSALRELLTNKYFLLVAYFPLPALAGGWCGIGCGPQLASTAQQELRPCPLPLKSCVKSAKFSNPAAREVSLRRELSCLSLQSEAQERPLETHGEEGISKNLPALRPRLASAWSRLPPD